MGDEALFQEKSSEEIEKFREKIASFKKEHIETLKNKRFVSSISDIEQLKQLLTKYVYGVDIYTLQNIEKTLRDIEERHFFIAEPVTELVPNKNSIPQLEEDERHIKERAKTFETLIKILDSSIQFWVEIMIINNIDDLDDIKKELLTSPSTRDIYNKGLLTLEELKDLEAEKIKILISEEAAKVYKLNLAAPDQLKNLDFENLKALYTEILRNTDLNTLKDKDDEIIKSLVSNDAKLLYRS